MPLPNLSDLPVPTARSLRPAQKIALPWETIVWVSGMSVGQTLALHGQLDGAIYQRGWYLADEEAVVAVRDHLLNFKGTVDEFLINDQPVVVFRDWEGPGEFSTDSIEYDILAAAARAIKDVPGATVEIGVRRGGGTRVMVDAMIANGDWGRTHICIDPYGNLPFAYYGDVLVVNYTNDMRKLAHPAIHEYARLLPIDLHTITMTDTDYFDYYAKGFPIYSDSERRVINEYALVHFDGQHVESAVQAEIEFFHPRAPIGAQWVFDDVDSYNHAAIDAWVLARGWEAVTRGERKIRYVRVA